jgi:Reverse transcriptase (RNA-dependent DNA polymerase)
VGPNIRNLLRNFWDGLQLVPHQSGFYGKPIPCNRGVTQGDPLSPMIFNIVVDAVVRSWRTNMLPRAVTPVEALFYADDGWLASEDAKTLQRNLDYFTVCFMRVGLQTNAAKTKSLVCNSDVAATRWSSPAFRRTTGRGLTLPCPPHTCAKWNLQETSKMAKTGCRKLPACGNLPVQFATR